MSLQYHIDHVSRVSGKLTVKGWALNHAHPEKNVHFEVRKGNTKVSFEWKERERPDVIQALYPEKKVSRRPGFEISVSLNTKESCELIMRSGFSKVTIEFNPESIHSMMLKEEQERIALEEDLLKKDPDREGVSYGLYQKMTALSEDDLKKQRERIWKKNSPLFSIVVPLYQTPHKALKEMLSSVRNQTYTKWELCLADGSEDDSLRKVIRQVFQNDPRVKYEYLFENRGISENTNAAVRMAEGDYIVFCDHDDLLSADALYEMADAIKKHPGVEYLYSDEDKTDSEGTYFFEGNFKSDWNPDLLRTTNYISHLSVVKKEVIDQTGLLKKEYDGAQDYDFVLRVSEKAKQIVHVPKVLYHWRTAEGSTASGTIEKSYASEAGRKAVLDHWKRKYPEIQVKDVEWNSVNGTYHTIFSFETEPMVSVILDENDMGKSKLSIEEGNWKNLEFLTMDHMQEAKGPYLLFIKSSVRMKNRDSIREMIGYARRKDTGVIGAEIFASDETIVSAGILMGIHGSYANMFEGQNPKEQNTYFSRDSEVQDLSAVSDEAFMIRKDLLETMHGFDESFQAEGKVIDLCLRCRKKGLWNIYDPYASFIAERNETFTDQQRIVQKYPEIRKSTDPFYNVNLTPEGTDFACRNPQREPVN